MSLNLQSFPAQTETNAKGGGHISAVSAPKLHQVVQTNIPGYKTQQISMMRNRETRLAGLSTILRRIVLGLADVPNPKLGMGSNFILEKSSHRQPVALVERAPLRADKEIFQAENLPVSKGLSRGDGFLHHFFAVHTYPLVVVFL